MNIYPGFVEGPFDLTTWALGSRFRGKPVERCPRCGRPGIIRRYQSGTGQTMHTGTIEIVNGMAMVTFEDRCFLTAVPS